MRIVLDRKGLEAPLPHVAGGAVAAVVTPYLRRQQPLEVTREIALGPRPEHQMEMVGHEAEAQQAHRHASTGRRQQFEKAAIVRVVMKHLTAGIAAVQDVVANTADGGARGTWHVNSLEVPNLAGKEKSRMSPFTPTCP